MKKRAEKPWLQLRSPALSCETGNTKLVIEEYCTYGGLHPAVYAHTDNALLRKTMMVFAEH